MTYVQKERTAAIIRAAIGAAALILGAYGITVDTEAWATVIMEAISIGALVYTWFWKNNNLTEAAINAQEYKDVVLSGADGYPLEIEEEEAEEAEEV